MRLLHTLVTAFLCASVVSAHDWTQWRGPSRDGAVAADVVPKAWPLGVNRLWRVEVGEGYSSPVVAAGRVFVHGRRDPEEMVTAVDVQTGKVLWQQKYQAPFAKNQYAIRMAKEPNSTPIVSGEHVFTLGVTGGTSSRPSGPAHTSSSAVFVRDAGVYARPNWRQMATRSSMEER